MRSDGSGRYQKHKDAESQRNREVSIHGRDIAPIPPVTNPERREHCRNDFRLFCETYFSAVFALGWSPDHLTVIQIIQNAILNGGLFAVAMPRGSGKALDLKTPLPTPTGWTTMGEVKVGDLVFDEAGQPTRVTLATEVMHDHQCYRVTFSDGNSIVADAEHLWNVNDRYSRKNPLTLTTDQMKDRLFIGKRDDRKECRYSIPLSKPLAIEAKNLKVDPYVLGVWLGDGTSSCSRVTLAATDFEIVHHIAMAGEDVHVRSAWKKGNTLQVHVGGNKSRKLSLQSRLRSLGVLNDKHIPDDYLRGSVEQRLAILQGLMDTDGSIYVDGRCEFFNTSKTLIDDVYELIVSLGFKPCLSTKKPPKGTDYEHSYRIAFTAYKDTPVFRMSRKRERQRVRPKYSISSSRTITAIEPVESVPVRCIQVDSPSHLYLAGRGMIPTHNTSLVMAAAVWSLVYGHRSYVVLIAASEDHAAKLLKNMTADFECNDDLLADFPEVVYPIRRLERIVHRAAGQLLNGEATRIGWTAKELILPTVPGSVASGSRVVVAGITGSIRGMNAKLADGSSIRPDFVLCDDPQTTESAMSPKQIRDRLAIVNGDILGLAGPKQKISAVMPVTVIARGDVADQVLDRKKNPEWQGVRTKMLKTPPTNVKMWESYADLWADGLRSDGNFQQATAFYEAHRTEMDQGAEASWPERFNEDEVSAIQNAMNLKLRDEPSFYAEYQNEPLSLDADTPLLLKPEQIALKAIAVKRGLIPVGVSKLTSFIDVQGKLLYYTVVGWKEDFTGHVVDYGCWPEQKRSQFTLREASPTFADVFKNTAPEGQIRQALEALSKQLLERDWQTDDGHTMRISRLLIDSGNWGDVIKQYQSQAGPLKSLIIASKGYGVTADRAPIDSWKSSEGDRRGWNWLSKKSEGHLIYDTNNWKTFTAQRLAGSVGEAGNLSIFEGTLNQHKQFAEHATSEYPTATEGGGRVVHIWKLRPNRENHWLDGLIGCAVAASEQGIRFIGHQIATGLTEVVRRRRKVSAQF
jgi:hypothetical protein